MMKLSSSVFHLIQDCLNDYHTNFTFNYCNDVNQTMKCDNGRCYNFTTLASFNATCNGTDNLLDTLPNEG